MTKNILRTGAFLLALVLSPLATTAGAHDQKGRKHRHKVKTTNIHVNHRNTTPGVARRVRRGRNTTPGVRRGAINSTTTIGTPRRNSAGAAVALEHGRGHGRARVKN